MEYLQWKTQMRYEYFSRNFLLTSVLTIQSYIFLSFNFSQRNSLYVLTVIYHEIISVFPYSDGHFYEILEIQIHIQLKKYKVN
jgi:hypothetical protein